VKNPVVIHVTAHNYNWLPQVQTAISSNSKRHIILVAQGEPLSGIVGLVNCMRKEPGGDFVRLETSCLNFLPVKEKPCVGQYSAHF
jgi:fatty acid synthase